MTRTLRATALVLALVLVAAACGSGDDGDSDEAEGLDLEPEALIRADEGGSVGLPDGSVQLDVPPGALAEDTTISVSEVPRSEYPEELADVDSIVINDLYRLEPDGLEFATPATLTIRAQRSSVDVNEGRVRLAVLLSRSSDGEWELLDKLRVSVDLEDEFLATSGELTHFSQAGSFKGGIDPQFAPQEVKTAVKTPWRAEVTVKRSDIPAWQGGALLEKIEWQAGGVVSGAGEESLREDLSGEGTVTRSNVFQCDDPGTGTFGALLEVGEYTFEVAGHTDVSTDDIVHLVARNPITMEVSGRAQCEGESDSDGSSTGPQIVETAGDCSSKGKEKVSCERGLDAIELQAERIGDSAEEAVNEVFETVEAETGGSEDASGVFGRAAGGGCEGILITYTVTPDVEELDPALRGEAAMQIHPEGETDAADTGVGISYREGEWSVFAFNRGGADPPEGTFAARAEGDTIAMALQSHGDGSCIRDTDEMRVKIQMEGGPLDDRVYDLALDGLTEYAPVSAYLGG